MSDVDLDHASPVPTRPKKLTVKFREEADSLSIQKNIYSRTKAFLVFALAVLSGGCAIFLVEIIREFTAHSFAFGILFLAIWVILTVSAVWIALARENLTLNEDKISLQRTALVRFLNRSVPLRETTGFFECYNDEFPSDPRFWGIEMVTRGRPLRFMFGLSPEERLWLIHQLNRFVGVVEGKAARAPLSPDLVVFDSPQSVEGITAQDSQTGPPSDSEWRLSDEPNEFTFIYKSRLDPGTLWLMLLVNALVNGATWTFLVILFRSTPNQNNPQAGFWWVPLLILIPLAVFGIVLLVLFLFVALEPLFSEQWRFLGSMIVRESDYLIFRRSHEWDARGLNRLEMRRSSMEVDQPGQDSDLASEVYSEKPYSLVLVTEKNVDLCKFPRLTEGEARWIAETVLRRRPEWFSF